MSTHSADCIAVIGASGMGKGVYITARLTAMPRAGRTLLIWSPLEATDQYARKFAGIAVRSIPDLVARVKARAPCVVLVPAEGAKVLKAQFDGFCRVAWHVPRAIVLVEELSRVTTPSYAPTAWRNLSTAGRHQGLTLIGAAQRPAQIDKDFMGNCTEVRAYRVNYQEDAKALAAVMHEPADTFLTLPKLHYVHRTMDAMRNERGVQPLPGQQRGRGRRGIMKP